MSRPKVRLKVGEIVSFTCRATDPQGREVQWTGDVMQNVQTHRVLASVTGASATLTWIVENNDVGAGPR